MFSLSTLFLKRDGIAFRVIAREISEIHLGIIKVTFVVLNNCSIRYHFIETSMDN